MFFSIIIPLYNRPQEIDELLASLCLQTYQQFEVLIIDDGSAVPAQQIVEGYAGRLDLSYYYKENSGQGFARNYGFERAKGDYFVIFDSDCLIPDDYLEIVSSYLFNHHLDAYGGPDAAHKSFTDIQKAISYGMTSVFTTGGIRGGKQHIGKFHPRSFNMGISAEVWKKTGGFILPRLGEDIEFSIRMQQYGFKTGLIPAAKVFHKRRTSMLQFYKQIHFFGRARINIYKHFPSELKAIHFFPAVFTLGLAFVISLNMISSSLARLGNIFLLVYFMLIFLHSLFLNHSFKVALLSVISSFIQLTAYGMGFIQDFFKRLVFKKP